MTLEWRQHEIDENCWVSICGNYCVSLDPLVGIWRSWKMAPGGPWFAPLGREPSTTVDEAKMICEEDRK